MCIYIVYYFSIGFSFNGTDITRLDTPPYNEFSILCSIIYYPTPELPSIGFSWTDNNTQDSVTFINSTMNNTRESIQLVEINSITPNTVINYIYTCQGSVEFPRSNSTNPFIFLVLIFQFTISVYVLQFQLQQL